jgi:hypothetical protein
LTGGNSGQMDQKITINSSTRKLRHPYQAFEGSPTWKRVERAISDLVKNGDIQEATRREYIIGYICKIIGADTEIAPKRVPTRNKNK